jgi:hypothetical protein
MTRRRRTKMPRDGAKTDVSDYRDDPEVIKEALDKATDAEPDTIGLSDFYAHMPDHRYIFEPTRDLWPASSVDARLPRIKVNGKEINASRWLDQNQSVEQMIWAPGEPTLIGNRLVDSGGWIQRPGVSVFNLYRPPTIEPGNPGEVAPWVDHINSIYDEHADHIIRWLAQRVQQPQIKINHALVLGGEQGIGKDTLLEPVKHAVGPWNCQEVAPSVMLGRFNGYVKSVILRVSEARDLGDMDRFTFYDHTKTLIAAPPDVHRCDEKNIREHSVLNVCGVIITTNHKSDGIYLPPDDRRHFVAWSDVERDEFDEEYWRALWKWYESGGIANVAAYLATLDLSGFDPKAPPPKTEAFWHIVNAARSHEEGELADVLDMMGNPDAVTIDMLTKYAKLHFMDLNDWLMDRRNRRQIPHKLESVGYEPIRNEHAKDGLWKIDGRRSVVYTKRTLTTRDRIRAATELAR